jgi:acetylornithine deacetylase/succinyl-diaminopimelate desuccinylase-like protein
VNSDLAGLHERPVELLQRLIRFDTTNPPGNEAACIHFVRRLLERADVESETYARDPARPNLVARLAGDGRAAPLLLYGHVDVVTTVGQRWSVPPFEGLLADGFVWGRGALDMKSGVTLLLCAFVRAKVEGVRPAGDVILAVVSDEENLGEYGVRFLVEQHPELFAGVRYALGEVGGATVHIDGVPFYPIEVAQKQVCWLRARVRGAGGHAAVPRRGGAMAKLGGILQRLERTRLPVHVTPVVERQLETMADALPSRRGQTLRALLDPARTDGALARLGERAPLFNAILRNTATPTIVRGGHKINVIPPEVELELDGRLLPGFTPDDLLAELEPIVRGDADLDLVRYDPGLPAPNLALFGTLDRALRELDPAAVPLPTCIAGVTDGRYLARLGIQTYGFLPLRVPPSFVPIGLAHGADERVPADALPFGVEAVFRVLERFGSERDL